MGLGVVAAAVAYTFARGDTEPVSADPVEVSQEGGASAAVVIEDAEQRAVMTALFASHPDHRDRLLLFPPSLLTIQPGLGERPLAEALRVADEDMVGLTITNLLGVRIDDVIVLDEEDVIAGLVGPLEVDLQNPYVVVDGEVQRVAAAAGLEPRSPQLVYELITNQGAESESALLLRQGRVWEALLDSIASDDRILTRLLAERSESVRLAMTGVAQDEGRIVAALPVTTAESVAGAGQQVVFDTAQTDEFVQGTFPYLQIAPEPRPVLELLNGNGGVGVTQPVAERLVEHGFRVIKTDNADRTDFPATQIISHGRGNEETAVAIRRLIGFGEVVLELRQPSGVFDVTIIVGNDIAPSGG